MDKKKPGLQFISLPGIYSYCNCLGKGDNNASPHHQLFLFIYHNPFKHFFKVIKTAFANPMIFI